MTKPHINYDCCLERWNIWMGHLYVCHGNTPLEAWQKWENVRKEMSKGLEEFLKERTEKRLTQPTINLPPNYFDNMFIGSHTIPDWIENSEDFIKWVRQI